MKKLFIVFCSLILCSFLTFSCFASSVENIPFLDKFRIGVTEIYGWTVGTDYTRSVSNSENDIRSDVHATESTLLSKYLNSWLTRFTCYDYNDDGSSSVSSLLYDEIITFNLKFSVDGLFSEDALAPDGSPLYFKSARVYIINPDYRNSLWNVGNHFYAGSVDFNSIDGFKANFTANVSYHNKGEDIDRLEFFIIFKSDYSLVLDYNLQTFGNYAYNYYKGSIQDAPNNLPIYNNPDDTIGNGANDLKDAEDNLNNQTSQGREDTINLFNTLADIVIPFSMCILAFSQVFQYLVGGTVFESILLISLALGLIMLVFNLVPSIFARQDKIDSRIRNRNHHRKE